MGVEKAPAGRDRRSGARAGKSQSDVCVCVCNGFFFFYFFSSEQRHDRDMSLLRWEHCFKDELEKRALLERERETGTWLHVVNLCSGLVFFIGSIELS